jgi:hypothetical protein
MLTREQTEELKKLAQPLCDWLNRNATPHDTIIVQQDHVEALCGMGVATFKLVD